MIRRVAFALLIVLPAIPALYLDVEPPARRSVPPAPPPEAAIESAPEIDAAPG